MQKEPADEHFESQRLDPQVLFVLSTKNQVWLDNILTVLPYLQVPLDYLIAICKIR